MSVAARMCYSPGVEGRRGRPSEPWRTLTHLPRDARGDRRRPLAARRARRGDEEAPRDRGRARLAPGSRRAPQARQGSPASEARRAARARRADPRRNGHPLCPARGRFRDPARARSRHTAAVAGRRNGRPPERRAQVLRVQGRLSRSAPVLRSDVHAVRRRSTGRSATRRPISAGASRSSPARA